ncbi:hypothetical protein [Indiicoccus explosivorum]|uniref:TolB family protein n=1 Tax=Indiicoccus explosivorum TaxID=1917864 RepID=UPI0030C6E173
MKKRVEIRDLAKLSSVNEPQLSPDGSEALFIRTVIDEQDNTYRTHLWHADLKTKKLTQWTHAKERVSQPRWSVDGSSAAFLSDRTEKNQLYVIPADGGEARKVTDFEKGVDSFRWAPDGTKIWVNGDVKDGGSFTDKEEEKEEKKPEPVRVTTMKYKQPDGGLTEQDVHQQIGLIDLETGAVEQVTADPYDHKLEAVSRDGGKLVYSVDREDDLDFIFRTKLYIYDTETDGERLILEEEGSFTGAVFRPMIRKWRSSASRGRSRMRRIMRCTYTTGKPVPGRRSQNRSMRRSGMKWRRTPSRGRKRLMSFGRIRATCTFKFP